MCVVLSPRLENWITAANRQMSPKLEPRTPVYILADAADVNRATDRARVYIC